jgi:hypothetical protein
MNLHSFTTVLFRIHGLIFCIWGAESVVRLWGVIPFYSAEKMSKLDWMWWLIFPALELTAGLVFYFGSRKLSEFLCRDLSYERESDPKNQRAV